MFVMFMFMFVIMVMFVTVVMLMIMVVCTVRTTADAYVNIFFIIDFFPMIKYA